MMGGLSLPLPETRRVTMSSGETRPAGRGAIRYPTRFRGPGIVRRRHELYGMIVHHYGESPTLYTNVSREIGTLCQDSERKEVG